MQLFSVVVEQFYDLLNLGGGSDRVCRGDGWNRPTCLIFALEKAHEFMLVFWGYSVHKVICSECRNAVDEHHAILIVLLE